MPQLYSGGEVMAMSSASALIATRSDAQDAPYNYPKGMEQPPYKHPPSALYHDLALKVKQPFASHLNAAFFLFRLLNHAADNNKLLQNYSPTRTTISAQYHMERNLRQLKLDLETPPELSPQSTDEILEWDWDIEHADRKLEAKADAAFHDASPFEVDRKVLKDVVRERMGVDVVRIKFLSAGTFHKAYLVTLADKVQVVARVARRFMPRLKTESEVATMQYIREHTNIPVPTVYHYDSNPYNRLGGEFILMSKAPGIPLAKVYHSLSYSALVKLLTNLAEMVVPLFAHRFSELGSLYFGPDPRATTPASPAPTPKAIQMHYSAFPFSPTLAMSSITSPKTPRQNSNSIPSQEYHVGPIISWPFFGSNRGDLTHPNEINRGPWSTTQAYFDACVEREVTGVVRENEGKAAPHKLHLDPDEIRSSRHHHMKAVPGDESDDSDEWDLEESEEEWEGPGDAMYRDYRRMQRTTFLIAHIKEREECVKREMARWMELMQRLIQHEKEISNGQIMHSEEYGLDCHDLSLENVFVDQVDHSKITCVIDWESTTTRPLWACAHLPAFLQYSPFTGKIFREIVAQMASRPKSSSTSTTSTPAMCNGVRTRPNDLPTLAREWLHYETAGMRLRMAHRFVEWDGWEEGLVDSMLGTAEQEDSWFKETFDHDLTSPPLTASDGGAGSIVSGQRALGIGNGGEATGLLGAALTRRKPSTKLPFATELEKEQMLDTTGDICGGRGGELGRRLEAWLTVNGEENISAHEPVAGPRRRWHNDEDEYDAEAESSSA